MFNRRHRRPTAPAPAGSRWALTPLGWSLVPANDLTMRELTEAQSLEESRRRTQAAAEQERRLEAERQRLGK